MLLFWLKNVIVFRDAIVPFFSARDCIESFIFTDHSLTHSAAELKNLNEQLVSMYEQEMDDLAANDVENHQPNDEEPKGSKTDSQEASFSNQEDKMSIFEDDDILA